jgi:hypothetical protein
MSVRHANMQSVLASLLFIYSTGSRGTETGTYFVKFLSESERTCGVEAPQLGDDSTGHYQEGDQSTKAAGRLAHTLHASRQTPTQRRRLWNETTRQEHAL